MIAPRGKAFSYNFAGAVARLKKALIFFLAGRSVLIAFTSCIGWLALNYCWTALLGQYLF